MLIHLTTMSIILNEKKSETHILRENVLLFTKNNNNNGCRSDFFFALQINIQCTTRKSF